MCIILWIYSFFHPCFITEHHVLSENQLEWALIILFRNLAFSKKKTIFQRSELYIGNQLGIDKQPLKYWSIVLKKMMLVVYYIFYSNDSYLFYIFFLECIRSYGENCKTPCHKHCINQTCDKFNGSCLYGCKEEGICVKGISIWILETFESCTLLIIYKILWS